MKYMFTAYGHPNILANHRTTLEITKDSDLTRKGDCIVAIGAGFSLQRIREIIGSSRNNGKIKLTIAADAIKDEITAVVNKEFSSSREIVLRKGDFISERTFGIRADKAANDINRRLIERLKDRKKTVSVTVEPL